MTPTLSRRDFLKATGALPLGLSLSPFLRRTARSQPAPDGRKNVLVVVFDAFSANHLSMHGYSRATTPHLARLAERAIVYHHHYCSGNFTTPGTASLLTGTLPWTHRALPVNSKVKSEFARKTIFHGFEDYHRIAYSHNPLANTLLKQFANEIDDFVPQHRLFLTTDPLVYSVFGKDEDIADVAWIRTIKKQDEGFSYSLLLSELYNNYSHDRMASIAQRFPRGVPNIRGDNFFVLETAIDWLQSSIEESPRPYLGYVHLMPPHAPCNTPAEFFGVFGRDGYLPQAKPEDVFTAHLTADDLLRQRIAYDEYILYVDDQFNRLFEYLEASGALEDTWLIFTSDHGELFERGVRGHYSPLLYQPGVHVPLMIFEPGRTTHVDITSVTSAVDLLPTLLHVTGHGAAEWTEGNLLPPFGPTAPDAERTVYSMYTNRSLPDQALTQATIMAVRGRYKLMFFFGYEELGVGAERVELYDLENDPDEVRNIYGEQTALGNELLSGLKAKLREVNASYA